MGRKKVATKNSKPVDGSEFEKIANAGPGIGGGSNFSFLPGSPGWPGTEALSNPNTMFKNLRWYLLSNDRQFLCQLYVEIGLVQVIVDVPIDDALRGGIKIRSNQLDEAQLEELKNSVDRDDDLTTVGQAAKWNRLFGGAGVMILVGDQDPSTPLDINSIGPDTPLEFRAVDMWELFWDKQNTDGYDPAIQEEDFEFFTYYGNFVHKSRVMRMKGITAPSFIRPRLRGWGVSVTETLVRSINQYFQAADLSFELLNQGKVDVYKIKNLINTLMSPNGQKMVMDRITMANFQKNSQNALVMDSEDDWAQKQISYAGIADMMSQIRMQVASDMRMPLTKLFGISAAGFNSGEDDIEVYNSMVEGQVRNKIKYDILRMLEIKCQKMFGFIPDDLSIEFNPLRVLSSEQEENVKTQKFARLMQAKQAGEISVLEFRDACNKGNLFDITLDNSNEVVGGFMDDTVEEGRNDPYDSTDIDNPGANRFDTQKPRATELGGASQDPVPPRDVDKPGDKLRPTKNNKKLSNPGDVDEALWKEAKEKSKKEYGEYRWPVITELYKKLGGVFKKAKNSPQFDKASYEADGGDSWIDSRRLEFFKNPGNKGLWEQCVEESRHLFGSENRKFTLWKYQKSGGSFPF